jgi:cobalt-zinc-cadmium efflux system protein
VTQAYPDKSDKGRRVTDCESQHKHGRGGKRLFAAFVVISVFMVVEFVGGILSGSLALLADAVHMFTDSVALGLALSAHWLSAQRADTRRHFGYHRAQVLAAFVNGLFLAGLLVWIVIEAIGRLGRPEVFIHWPTMLGVAIVGLAANAVALAILHGEHAGNLNVRGAMLHVVADLLGSVAAVAAAIVIWLTGWMPIDALLSILVAALIAASAFRLLKESAHILLEGAPRGLQVKALIEGVEKATPGLDITELQVWQLTPDHARLTMKARVAKPADLEGALDSIKTYLADRHGITESTIEISTSGSDDRTSALPTESPGFVLDLAQSRKSPPVTGPTGPAYASQK